ncbi:hypothetical protein VTO42DRAFT_6837 [Malbranchea cinnamomea]
MAQLDVDSSDMEDPFLPTTPAGANSARESHRYSTFDTQLFTLNASSPAQLKRALEAHLAETERRLEEASKLGTALVNQQKELTEKLHEVERQEQEAEIGPELRQRLIELEREYNEIGRETARATLGHRQRHAGPDDSASPSVESRFPASPSVFSSQATNSPSKVTVPTRKQRNQKSSRIHDIEFATEISTSLLAQVRQLQALLAERDQTLKQLTLEKSRLELEAEGFTQRLRALDESEQRYKDENWSLETQKHELLAAAKEASAREDRLTSSLNAITAEKNNLQRELDELRQAHSRLLEDSAAAQKSHDSEIHILRRNVSQGDAERSNLQAKIEELTSQNQELAKAVAASLRQQEPSPQRGPRVDEETKEKDDKTPDSSPPPSPAKPTPRHNHLETETLKSSLHHAHRMIQNLKNNIHREKTEKLELKRMLQEARDELEQRRAEQTAPPIPRRQRTKTEVFKRPQPRLDKLGASRKEVTKVIDEPEWEDHLTDTSPTRPAAPVDNTKSTPKSGRSVDRSEVESVSASDAYHTANETEDAFETANERATATESEAFQTGMESFAESSDDLTETEDRTARFATVKAKKPSALSLARPGDRTSMMSTASTSADEDDYRLRTPVQAPPQRYRLRLTRGRRGHSFEASADSGGEPMSPRDSPASFNSPPQRIIPAGQSLFAELSGLATGSDSEFGTPGPETQMASPFGQRRLEPSQTVDTAPLARQLLMVDAGMMTDPWEPAVAPFVSPNEPQVNGEQSISTRCSVGVDTTGLFVTEFVDAGTQYTPISPSPITKSDVVTILDTPPQMALDADKEKTSTADSDVHLPVVVPHEPLHLQLSPIFAETTAPVSPDSPPTDAIAREPHVQLGVSSISSESTVPLPAVVPTATASPELTISQVQAVTTEPIAPSLPAAIPNPEVQQLKLSPLHTEETRPVTPVATRPSLTPQSAVLYPDSGVEDSPDRPRTAVREAKSIDGDYPPLGPLKEEKSKPVNPISAAGTQTDDGAKSPELSTRDVGVGASVEGVSPAAVSKKTVTGAAQTILTGTQIDQLLLERASRPMSPTENRWTQMAALDSSPSATPKAKPQRAVPTATLSKESSQPSLQSGTAWRPASAGSQARSSISISHPPLPTDHKQAIATAGQKLSMEMSPGVMGPPIAPASAYRSTSQVRPRTPSEQVGTRNGATSRTRVRRTSQMSRRSSLSSFASELEDRFNMGRPQYGFDSGADPRMIQAITQTMIGEFLWKYTRKPGRPEMSNTRHRRYFWVHPYTRTLYWSLHDPQTAGKSQLKAKSVAIEAVRVVTDENPYPPGLHQKSLEIISPGRVVKFTAATSQRHETWLNALSYLLLRTGGEEDVDEGIATDDANEFTPYSSLTRPAESRRSMSSHNSRTAHAVSRNYVESNIRTRQPVTPGRTSPSISSSRPNSTLRAPSARQSSVSRISNIFRNSGMMGTFSSRRGRHDDARESMDDDASEASQDSAEELRRIMERQDREADRLENVRACCDGKHDVSSLPRTSRYSSRVSYPGHTHG